VPIYYPDVLDQGFKPRTFSYTDKDVMLYALGVGFGEDPMNETELPFVYERNLKVVPTAASVLTSTDGAHGGEPLPTPPGHRRSEPNLVMLVHGEQKMEFHRPLPPSGTFTVESRTIGAFDKGKDKGAVLLSRSIWRDSAGVEVVTVTNSAFCRGDGGFGGPSEGQPEPHPTPARAPDLSVDFQTRPGQALLYRLNGDRNPLHADPEFAGRAGFPQPILHGLCTYGVTCRAVLQEITGFDPEPILSHQVRFSSPVFPGDVVTVDLWKDGREIAFEARVKARNVTVIKNGLTVLRG
jgi:acyl dehydratase